MEVVVVMFAAEFLKSIFRSSAIAFVA